MKDLQIWFYKYTKLICMTKIYTYACEPLDMDIYKEGPEQIKWPKI